MYAEVPGDGSVNNLWNQIVLSPSISCVHRPGLFGHMKGEIQCTTGRPSRPFLGRPVSHGYS